MAATPSNGFVKLLKKEALGGQFNLGIRYAHGDGVTQDIAEARKWFKKAADQNDAMSQFCLCEMFEKGLGVVADQAEAYKWYCLAACQEIRAADNARRRLQTNLTPEQIAAGQAHPMPPVPKKSA